MLERLFTRWWFWPALLLIAGAGAFSISWLATPVGEDVHLFGYDMFEPCPWKERTGDLCGSCGMTRSWVWMARGELQRSLGYNPAGTLLFLGLVAGGLVGAMRLVTRRPRLLRLPWKVTAAVWVGWAVLVGVLFFLRAS